MRHESHVVKLVEWQNCWLTWCFNLSHDIIWMLATYPPRLATRYDQSAYDVKSRYLSYFENSSKFKNLEGRGRLLYSTWSQTGLGRLRRHTDQTGENTSAEQEAINWSSTNSKKKLDQFFSKIPDQRSGATSNSQAERAWHTTINYWKTLFFSLGRTRQPYPKKTKSKFFRDRCVWPSYVGENVCLTVLFMYTYVCRHMQEGLVNPCIDMYESEPTSALTPKGHGVRITTSTPS